MLEIRSGAVCFVFALVAAVALFAILLYELTTIFLWDELYR